MQQFNYDGEAVICRPIYNDVRVKSHFTQLEPKEKLRKTEEKIMKEMEGH